MEPKAEQTREFEEIFGVDNAMLFKEEFMSPVFCKPKLLPLKTVTMEKMEKMQKEAIELLKTLEQDLPPPPESNIVAGMVTEPIPEEEEKNEVSEIRTDIWSADD